MPQFDNSGIVEFVKRLIKITNKAMAIPRGTKHAELQEYLKPFTGDELDIFFKKLATSQWVNNEYFSLNRLVKEDIVRSVIAGGTKELEVVNKYYHPKRLVIVRYKNEPMPEV
jgi:hypothetical protein